MLVVEEDPAVVERNEEPGWADVDAGARRAAIALVRVHDDVGALVHAESYGLEGLVADLVPRTASDKYVPSADRMMASVAEACGPAVLGVVLTGMGNDGTAGALAIKRKQGQCLAESEESAVIFGMPQEAIRAGAADKVLPLSKMADEIALRCTARDP